MDFRTLLIFIIVSLTACQSINKEDNSKLGMLKKAVAENPSLETRKALIEEYRATIQANPMDAEKNVAYINDIAQLQIDNKAFTDAVQTLMEGIKAFFSASGTPSNVWSLASIYENNLRSPIVAGIIKKLYAQQFLDGEKNQDAQQFVQANTSSIVEDIQTLGGTMYDEKTHRVDFKAANDFIRICQLYAILKPKDSLSPDYLHKAGETARAIRAFPQAIELYDWIYAQYPDYEKASQALFLKAFTYDNDLKDKEIAKKLYEEFLQKFPNDDFADDTQFLLDNLGKDDEEIIKSFGEK